METILIADLSPGEPVVTVERVGRQAEQLAAGNALTPIKVFEDAGRILITDGTNRVRALVERGHESVVAVRCTKTPSAIHLNELRIIADKLGRGKDALLQLPKVSDDEYYAAQAEFWRRAR
jgi:hypothetical protein